ncbi:hypothetical protein [Flavivirga jejuensis]|uniref:Uncharacterized protein n=1 Tax=Flavivirga jejuensis TaxID=870487 RepID=A0ABT8WT56_9FLAO|nr:hypothetical protein [Flavivirga jejuensis]MDO5976274.1 hypothetical protein [Flavivirga jejuensis]
MNKTERKFKCIGTKEIKVSGWSSEFVVGGIYNEAVKLNNPNHLSLIDNPEDGQKLQWLVDKSQFELVNDSDILETKQKFDLYLYRV